MSFNNYVQLSRFWKHKVIANHILIVLIESIIFLVSWTSEKALAKATKPAANKSKKTSTVRHSSDIRSEATAKRAYLKQADVPIASLNDALRLPQTIFDHYAGKATSPFNVAKGLNVDPKGSQFRLLSGAAIAFGLVEGGAQATSISVTDLATRIIKPKIENQDVEAKREAVLRPRVFSQFLRQYDGNLFPRADIALNVLEGMGVPRDKAEDVLGRIDESALSVDFIQEINGKSYVKLDVASASTTPTTTAPEEDPWPAEQLKEIKAEPDASQYSLSGGATRLKSNALVAAVADDQRRRKVFITHGKDRQLVEPIKKLLEFGELEPVVSVERQSVSKPVPEKFMDDMRKSGAAIIHVDAEKVVVDSDSVEHVILNPNVLIEIGAAMAFYGRRFILLVKDGVKLPSNLQGLYEVRYSGDTLNATSTIKLLEAIKDIKNHSLPSKEA